MKNIYKISELGKIMGISKQTLIFYHKENILIPHYIDENNGYRYYSNSQIWDLFFIIKLKEAGFSLQDIKEYTQLKDSKNNIEFLEKKVVDIDSKIEELKKSKKKIKDKISIMKEIYSESPLNVSVIKKENMRGLFIPIKNPIDDKEIAETYNKLHKLGEKFQLKNITFITTVDYLELKKGGEFPLKEVGLMLPDNLVMENLREIPSKLYVTMQHKSTFEMIKITYEKLNKYIQENKYEIIGDSIEIGSELVIPLDNGFGGNIQIYIPVKKI